MLTAWSH